MKKIFLFFSVLMVAFFISVSAQPSAAGAAKTTDGNASRVIGIVSLTYNGTSYDMSDSTTYSYSGARGGDPFGTIEFDTSIKYSLSPKNKLFQTFDVNKNILSITLQLVYGSGWQNNLQYLYTYDGSNNMLTKTFQAWDKTNSIWVNNTKTVYTYDGANNNLTSITAVWDSIGDWVNATQGIFTYTSANKKAALLYQKWNRSSVRWDNDKRTTNTYDISNNLITSVDQGWNSTSSAWDNLTNYTFTYDVMNNQLTDLTQFWLLGKWKNSVMKIKSSFLGNTPQVIETQLWDIPTGSVTLSRELITLNSFGQPTYSYVQGWNTAGFYEVFDGNSAKRYYYETYATAIQDVISTCGFAKIFPVPASDYLNIALTWEEPQSFTVAIYSLAGDIVKHWKENSAKKFDANYSLGNMSDGNYLIKIQGEKGLIVKQFIVAH